MSAPKNEYAFDPQVAAEAAKRWRHHGPEREDKLEAISRGDFLGAEPKERLLKRVNHLQAQLREFEAKPEVQLPRALSNIAEHETFTAGDISNPLVERVIGETRDFLSIDFIDKALYVNRCVGRIVTQLPRGRKSFGTGFLVSPRLLLTNQHVLENADTAQGSTVEFNYQLDRRGQPLAVERFELDPGKFFLNDKDLDFALVAVHTTSTSNSPLSSYDYLSLIGAEGKISIGEPINIIQHPLGEMKQIVLRQNRLLDLPDRFAHYEADTEPGSSGSPVFNDQWEVVALHHSGVPKTDPKGNLLTVDGKIWRNGDDPTQLAWVANEGIRVSRLVAFIKDAKPQGDTDLRDELLELGSRRSDLTERQADTSRLPESEPVKATSQAEGKITLTVPLQLTLQIGNPQELVLAQVSDSNKDTKALEALDQDYSNRTGYVPDFLGFSVPLPRLSNTLKRQTARTSSTPESYELKYHHFSVVMNQARKLAFFSAVNFDLSAPFQYERDDDNWYLDPRIDEAAQAGNEFYKHNPLDRGHLTRRADAAWGYTSDEARYANDDSFHFTNIAPQHEIFNQSGKAKQRGLLLWGNLENYIALQAAAGNPKLSTFNGPVFRHDDPVHRGLQVPREYWKLIVLNSGGTQPMALAFVLSQESLIRDLAPEGFEVGPYETYQVRLRDLEAKTKLDFGSLRSLDPLAEPDADEAFGEAMDAVPILTYAGLVLGPKT